MAGFKDHFSSHAAGYAAFRPGYPRELAQFLADSAPGRDLALDCGCGTGQLSGLLAAVFARVVATDASAQQIAQAAPLANVEYRCAAAERSGLATASADLVTVAQAAHWFDLEAFYPEVRRVLRPRGVLALITYGVCEMDGEPGALLHEFYHVTAAPFWPPERRHVESGYRTLPFPLRERPAPAFHMQAAWTAEQLIGYVDTWSAVRALEAAQGHGPVEAFAARVRAVWGDPAVAREIRWPLAIRIGD